jgi:hypothetical protein
MPTINPETFPAIYAEFDHDVCQAAWMHIWRYRNGYNAAYPLSTFIALGADHAASRYWRNRSNKPEFLPIAEDYEDDTGSAVRQIKPYVPRTVPVDRGVIVRDILRRLPKQNRLCLELREYGLSQNEVGRELGFTCPGPLERRSKERFKSLWKTGYLRQPHPNKGKRANAKSTESNSR